MGRSIRHLKLGKKTILGKILLYLCAKKKHQNLKKFVSSEKCLPQINWPEYKAMFFSSC